MFISVKLQPRPWKIVSTWKHGKVRQHKTMKCFC